MKTISREFEHAIADEMKKEFGKCMPDADKKITDDFIRYSLVCIRGRISNTEWDILCGWTPKKIAETLFFFETSKGGYENAWRGPLLTEAMFKISR